MVIPADDVKELRKPWARALIVKVFGRTISFRFLQQKLDDLWNLDKGCELIDLDEGYYIVRF